MGSTIQVFVQSFYNIVHVLEAMTRNLIPMNNVPSIGHIPIITTNFYVLIHIGTNQATAQPKVVNKNCVIDIRLCSRPARFSCVRGQLTFTN